MLRFSLAILLPFTLFACGATPEPALPFADVTDEAGLQFEHRNAAEGEFYLPEIVGAGLAWIDYDRDGDIDLYVVQTDPQSSDRLFRNDGGRFVDVTESMQIPAGGFGMGVAVGDYDGDGWDDLYVTQLGENRLLRNDNGQRFVDQTEASGIRDPWWSVSATWTDIDRDGRLDLFVADYLDWSVAGNQDCFRTNGLEDYCGPASYLPIPDRLFRNLGNGQFEEWTSRSGIAATFGAGLGVLSVDFNGDGWLDVYVANDGLPNQLWINLGDGRFEDRALLAGCALNADGKAEASMGVDAADFDEDGDLDLFMAHLNEETNTLYVNDGDAGFTDRSAALGVGPPSEPFTGFGGGWFDMDNDGDWDLYVVNGAVRTLEDRAREGDEYPFDQPNQLFVQRDGRFAEWVGALGDIAEVSRGSALGDYDNDGDLDLAISNSNGRLRLLRNEIGTASHWIGFSAPQWAGHGVQLELALNDGRRLHRLFRRDGSYASSNDARLIVGLGEATKIEELLLRWPDGTTRNLDPLEIDRWHTLDP